MSAELPWRDCKVAFDCNYSDIFEDKYFEAKLPAGWEVNEFDGSGARLVVVFRIKGLLRVGDGKKVLRLIKQFDKKLRK